MGVQLVIEDFEGAKTVFPLGDGAVTIGRQEGNTIQLTEKNVSRSHALLRPVDDGWQLEDLQSYNGVRLNGELIEGVSVCHDGDLIQIGDYQIQLGDGETALKATKELGPALLAAANEATPDMDSPAPSIAAREDLDPAVRPVAVAAPVTDSFDHLDGLDDLDTPPKGKGGLVAVLLLLIAGGAGGYYFWSQSQAADGQANDAPAAAASASADVNEADPADRADADSAARDPAVPDSGDEPEDAGEPEDAAADDGEPEIIDDADDGEVDEIEPEPEPAVVKDPTPAPTPAPAQKKKKKKKSATALLADARKAQLAGRYSSAYSLARKAYSAKASQEAAQVMGVAACKMGDAGKAKSALSKLSGSTKSALKSVCAGAGIKL